MGRRREPGVRRPAIGALAAVMLILLGALAIVGCATSAPSTPWTVELLSPAEYDQKFGDAASHLLIDVRTPEEFASGHIEGAINIPVESLSQRLNEVPKDSALVVYCRTGNRSATAAQILVTAGYGPVYDLGGIQAWVSAGNPIVK